MTDSATIPVDDPTRTLTVANPDDPSLRHYGVVGDTYTILVSGAQTGGRYCLIDMLVPDGGGPPPHRHDFEEMFTLLEGEVEFTFRGHAQTAAAGTTINVPANAPHAFANRSANRHGCSACARPRGRTNSFARSVSRSQAAPRRRRNSPRRSRRRS